MRTRLSAFLLAAGAGAALMAQGARPADRTWTTSFVIDSGELVTTGRNPYFILEPGYVLTLEDRDTRLVITVLDETRPIDNVDTRVVEERETSKGQLVEVSRNFFAIRSGRTRSSISAKTWICTGTARSSVTKARGARREWRAVRAGDAGAAAGVAKYYQEIAPGVAMDRAEIVGLNELVKTPAGEFKDVLKMAETTPLEPAVREFESCANGVGLIQDGSHCGW